MTASTRRDPVAPPVPPRNITAGKQKAEDRRDRPPISALPTALPHNSSRTLSGEQHLPRESRLVDRELIHRQRHQREHRRERSERGERRCRSSCSTPGNRHPPRSVGEARQQQRHQQRRRDRRAAARRSQRQPELREGDRGCRGLETRDHAVPQAAERAGAPRAERDRHVEHAAIGGEPGRLHPQRQQARVTPAASAASGGARVPIDRGAAVHLRRNVRQRSRTRAAPSGSAAAPPVPRASAGVRRSRVRLDEELRRHRHERDDQDERPASRCRRAGDRAAAGGRSTTPATSAPSRRAGTAPGRRQRDQRRRRRSGRPPGRSATPSTIGTTSTIHGSAIAPAICADVQRRDAESAAAAGGRRCRCRAWAGRSAR